MENGLDEDQEISNTKLRMEKNKEKENEEYNDEEKDEIKEMEAKERQVFDPVNRKYDARKRRVTDLKECIRITLPGPLSPEEESNLEVRKRSQQEIFEKYRKENTNSRGEQESNLTKQEKSGMRSIKERLKKEEIIIMKTDKSNRFVVTNVEEYLKMGEAHVSKDKEISRNEVQEIQKIVNGHSMAFSLIFNSGQDHNHTARIIRSKNSNSENQASLNLLYKDHKEGRKTRPVATGNQSGNLGLSNAVSEVLEAVARTQETPYSAISSDDASKDERV